ncbi:uncharacterized protein TRIADDRAFT_59862 [Trichoplax adhaerens]|uniref:Protein arginine N-methyltransferase n=1 Tax=Trichoplax adhaerens TaxID=10228 RepID=B3S6M9_TRIAD|nr:hypothetical protein TRIADDRAFT_59862 [Trichoplax adhaerens]EDV21786.1 hypothetical protein TRIADDRAFT_59862 [Trichoplax adhaerens]|eukprot:XP_002115934.1 hypothetical protein TRIADDRAFT_59862 [Trichoplax adhaerens]
MADNQGRRFSCGIDFFHVPDLRVAVTSATEAGFDFVCTPISHPRCKREFIEGPARNRGGLFAVPDALLSGQEWSSSIVGKISPWILPDSVDEATRYNSEKALNQELSYASHLSLPAITVQLNGGSVARLASILNSYLNTSLGHQQVWIQVPLCATNNGNDAVRDTALEDPWGWWNTLRSMCSFHKRLGLVLEVTQALPTDVEIDRWFGEPIKCLSFPTSIFRTNKKGYPVLSRGHQEMAKRFFKLRIQSIVSGNCQDPTKNQPPLDDYQKFVRGYGDYLQWPLQPLMDNLDSQTYEVFEKDPVKYARYEEAIYLALLDRIESNHNETYYGNGNNSIGFSVVMVLGAGRGPLVKATLRAGYSLQTKLTVYAIEKNPNAVITLQNLKAVEWGDQVTVVSTDMREWEPPCKADIIVSELLGSFGDNELSPECLDGAMKYLNEGGISIPSKYSSYLSPFSSSKLYNEVRDCREKDRHPLISFETPFVVHLHNVHIFSDPLECFSFSHPNSGSGSRSNDRYICLTYQSPSKDTVLTGFAGYFEAILYKNVTISTVPERHSEGMFSWFPIMFPLREPIYVKAESRIDVHFWRKSSASKVWYEWCVTNPYISGLHNPNGRSYTIGL